MSIMIEGQEVKITNPEKILWPELEISKLDYIKKLIELSPYILPHTTNRYLTTIRYPHGISGKSFYQKKINAHTPVWIDGIQKESDNYINLNKMSTLVWLGNQAALELHTTFSKYNDKYISNLVFDLDPSDTQNFNQVIECALIIYEELNKLNIKSLCKTSGSSGLQIYIPVERKYTYEDGRKINHFFALFFSKKYPKLFTIERSTKKRGNLLYFDYLQMWKGKSIISVYSPRAVKSAAVSTPIEWNELKKGIQPSDFNLLNIIERLNIKGDLFNIFLTNQIKQNLDFIFEFIKKTNNE